MAYRDSFDLDHGGEKTRMKNYRKLIITIIISVMLIVGLFWYYHPTHYRFNDRFVIGSSIGEIISEYGNFDKVFYAESDNKTMISAGYRVEEEKVGFFGTSPEKYYMIIFDVNGKAIKVSIEVGNWGG